MTRTCTMCGFEAPSWSSPFFARWDKLCIGCRAGVEAMERAEARQAAKSKPGSLTNSEAHLVCLIREGTPPLIMAERLRRDLSWVRSKTRELRARGVNFRLTTATLPEGGLPVPQGSGRSASPRGNGKHRTDRAEVLA